MKDPRANVVVLVVKYQREYVIWGVLLIRAKITGFIDEYTQCFHISSAS